MLFVFASLACAAAQSLPILLICRLVQGVSAAGTTTIFAVIRDLFEQASDRAKIGSVIIAIDVVTMIAPTAGAALHRDRGHGAWSMQLRQWPDSS